VATTLDGGEPGATAPQHESDMPSACPAGIMIAVLTPSSYHMALQMEANTNETGDQESRFNAYED
jgi:hypothetical protein